MLFDCAYKRDVNTDAEVKRIKAAYNRTINKVLCLYTVEAK
jgi:hypothetical protein